MHDQHDDHDDDNDDAEDDGEDDDGDDDGDGGDDDEHEVDVDDDSLFDSFLRRAESRMTQWQQRCMISCLWHRRSAHRL
eukprot:3302015-Karenia_brevis.AAC.1